MDSVIKNVAMYLRISREKQETEDTLQSHRERLTRLCNERGYKFTTFEEVLSGQTNLEDRIALNNMLDRIKEFDAVVCVSIDRLSRDLEYSINIFKRLGKAGVPVITCDRIYTNEDFLIFGMESLMAHQEYTQIRKRMIAGKKDKALRGETINSIAPYGYDFIKTNDRRSLTPNQDADKVKQIYNLAINGYSLVKIGKMMDKPTRSLDRILHNVCYIGTASFNGIEVPNAFTPIIDRNTFDKAQLAIKGRYSGREARSRNGRGKINTILRDLLFCDECGRKISFQMNSNKKYLVSRKCICGLKGSKEDYILSEFYSQLEMVEEQFKEAWQNILDTPLEDGKGLLESQLAEHTKQKDKLERRLKNALTMKLDMELSKSEYEEVKSETEASLNELQKKMQGLSIKIESMDKETVTKLYEDKLDLIGRFKALGESPKKGEMIYGALPIIEDKESANRLLKLLIDKIYYSTYIDEDGVERVKLLIAPK